MTGPMRLFLLALPLALAACRGAGRPEADTAVSGLATVTLTPSDIATARRLELVAAVPVSGSLEPIQTIVVKAQVAGRIRRITVDRGSRVSRGQVLVELEAEGVRGQAASAQAGVVSAEAALALANQRLEAAKRLNAAGAISDIELRTSEASQHAAAAQFEFARAQLATAKEANARTSIASPIDGVVSARRMEAGEAVKDGDQVLELVDIGTLELVAQVGVDEAVKVRVGLPVTFTIDALGGQTFQGRVARIDPRASAGTRQVGLAAQLPNPGGRIVAGQFARGRVLTGGARRDSAVAIPVAAVSDSAGRAQVFVIHDGKLALRPVTLGARDESRGFVAVTSGLTDGEQILARPVSGAANGLPVTIATDSLATPPAGKR
ncbi:MAG: Multidrug resistance protein MdtA [Gemmatimonadaceae bacterium]|nr:Multidrug resistance protein MdtA [Gemmatimonadaceae bacterium]